MIEITAEDAIAGLQQAVNEKGESYVYEPEQVAVGSYTKQCVYVDGDRPCCIVGHAFNYLGVPLNIFDELDPHNQAYNTKQVLATKMHLYRNGVVLKDEAIRCLSAAQRTQDRGWTWGEALQAAKERLAELEGRP